MPREWRARAARAGPLLGLLLVLGVTAPALAGGLGGSFAYAHGDGEIGDTSSVFKDIDSSVDAFRIGIAYDTNLSRRELLSYRVSLSYQAVEQRLQLGGLSGDVTGHGVALDQLLGFALERSRHARWMIGPSLHVGWARFDDRDGIEFRGHLVNLGLGPELGLNWHVSERVSISLTGFYRFTGQLQVVDDPFGVSQSNGRLLGIDHRFGFTTTIFFRDAQDHF